MEPQRFCYAVFNKRNTHRRRYCTKCNNGFVDNLQMRNHDCTKKDEYTKGRYKCSECAYEAYNITNMWGHCDKEKHPTGTEQGGICKRCNKGFATEKSRKHKLLLQTQRQTNTHNKVYLQTMWKSNDNEISCTQTLQKLQERNMEWWYTRRRSRCEKVNHRTQYG